MAPRDPILGLNEQFNADPNPAKVNLGVGVYFDANGKLPLLACVAAAERQLVAAAKIPALALFPANAVPGPLVPELGLFYGNGNLVRQSMLTAAAADFAANSCPGNALPGSPGFPASLSAAAPVNCRPAQGFRAAAVANDLRNWVPRRPMMMCGGAGDPVVNFISSRATMGYFLANGGDSSQLTLVDLEDATQGSADTYATARQVFAANRDALPDQVAVYSSYHWPLAAVPCHLAARQFFDRMLASGQ
jgi:hypothetical protein